MSKKFLQSQARGFSVEVSRNSFDVSGNLGATYNTGLIYPMFCRRVFPNTSYRIKATGLFNLFPTVAELQTQIRMMVRFHFVRNRTIWKNWKPFSMQDKASKTNNYPHPIIVRSENFCKVGSLAQHLGVSCVTYGKSNYTASCKPFSGSLSFIDGATFRNLAENLYYGSDSLNSDYLRDYVIDVKFRSIEDWSVSDSPSEYAVLLPLCLRVSSNDSSSLSLKSPFAENFPQFFSNYHAHSYVFQPMSDYLSDYSSGDAFVISHIRRVLEGTQSPVVNPASPYFNLSFYSLASGNLGRCEKVYSFNSQATFTNQTSIDVSFNGSTATIYIQKVNIPLSSSVSKAIQEAQTKYGSLVPVLSVLASSSPESSSVLAVHGYYPGSLEPFSSPDKPYYGVRPGFYGNLYYPSVMEVSSDAQSPFVGAEPSQGLNALPFRAYEAIYNSHYRNKVLDPFTLDGVVQVDNYVTNNNDGADTTTPLVLQVANYESDYFTDCMPSPQGNMFNQPLVGITVAETPDIAILHYSDNGTNYDVQVSVSGSGNMTGVNTYSQDANHHTIDILKDAISYGINLHDLESVRALSKWYEATYRQGRFSYDDFIGAHFGKNPQHDEMMQPEFLGGYDAPLNTGAVINNSASGDVSLGAKVGLGMFAAGNDTSRQVECYCDEDGFIIGTVVFSVTPTYSQSMDRMWFANHQSDYPTPEFANLGVMEVLNREIAPLQCDWSNSDPDTAALGTFGYQRMYGDMISNLDRCVGLYTSQELVSYIMNRKFDSVPKLSKDFLKQYPEDLTNVFVQENDKDKIYGVWHIDVQEKVWLQQRPNAQIF